MASSLTAPTGVLLGDCRDLFRLVPDRSVRLLLTDPPYGIASDSKITFTRDGPVSNREAWGDAFKDDQTEAELRNLYAHLASEALRVLADDGSLITFFDKARPHLLEPLYRALRLRNDICFIKKNPSPHIRKNNYRVGWEEAIWFSREKYHINFLGQDEMVNVFYGAVGNVGFSFHRLHPTQKYDWMIRPLILRHSDPGDLVLDPYCGSGTVPAIAKSLNRRGLGFEILPEYARIAQERFSTVLPDDSSPLEGIF